MGSGGRTLEPEDLAYLAGFFDGEGHVEISGESVRIGIANTNNPVLQWIAAKTGVNVTVHSRACPKGCGKRHSHARLDCFNWRVPGERAVAVLEVLIPYLKVKRAEAQKLVDHWQSRAERLPSVKAVTKPYLVRQELKDLGWPIELPSEPHGTLMWFRRGCRCDPCIAASKVRNQVPDTGA